MKTEMKSLFKAISEEQIKNLVTEVKETIADENNYQQVRIFSSADLWNIQRRGKAISRRKHLL